MKAEETDIDFENSLGPWIGKTTKIMDYYLQEAMQRHELDMSKEQMVILKKLHDQDGLNQNELAFLTYRDKSSLARLLSKMEQKCFITRKQHTEDKRINNVFLTPTGRAIFLKTKPAIKELIDTMEQHITKDEKDLVIQILKKVQENFVTENIQPIT